MLTDSRRPITGEGADKNADPADGSIDFDHVYFKYSAESSEWILEDVSLHIPSGKTVGILGSANFSRSRSSRTKDFTTRTPARFSWTTRFSRS